MFAIFNYAIIIYSWWILRETQGKSLEEMEDVFGSVEMTYDIEAVRAQARARWAGKTEGLERAEGESVKSRRRRGLRSKREKVESLNDGNAMDLEMAIKVSGIVQLSQITFSTSRSSSSLSPRIQHSHCSQISILP